MRLKASDLLTDRGMADAQRVTCLGHRPNVGKCGEGP